MDRMSWLGVVRAASLRWFCLLGLVWINLLRAQGPTPSTKGPFRIVGYLPDYRVAGFDAKASAALTDLIVFSSEPTAEGGLDLSRLNGVSWAELQAFKKQEQVRLHLAVGGWGRSRLFGKVSTTPALRVAFAQAVEKACVDLQLDGIDLDWEHPVNAAEEEGYGLLMAELRRVLAPGGRTLSVTVAGWQKLTPLVIQTADFVQLMAYDQPGAHSTFDGALADVGKLRLMGVPRAKLVLGVPFYGRHRTDRNRTPTYREIVERWKPAAGVDEVEGICFNGPETMRRKAAYARDEGMAGVMIWEVGQDAVGEASLLRVVSAEIGGRAAQQMAEGKKVAGQAFQLLSGQLMGAMAKGGPIHAIDFCSTRALALTSAVGSSNRVELQRVTHAPRNPANVANPLEVDLIARFQAELLGGTNPPMVLPAPVLRTNASGARVFYAPIVLSNPLCLQCHGVPGREIAQATAAAIGERYPQDRATGFRVGDVRGLWKVVLPVVK